MDAPQNKIFQSPVCKSFLSYTSKLYFITSYIKFYIKSLVCI